MEVQDDLTPRVLERMKKGHKQSLVRASHGEVPQFMVRDTVLVAYIVRVGSNSRPISKWTGPWRVVDDDKKHVHKVEIV